MHKLLKTINFSPSDTLIWFGLSLAYFLLRLPNLLAIPIFTDEAIYLWWAQVMANDAALRYLPLADGKPPLFMWLMSIAMKLLGSADPLFVGRLVSVFAGFFALIGAYFTARVLFADKKVALVACLLYLLIPFTLFYDRMALADSLLAAFSIWSIGIGALMAKRLNLSLALILGWIVGLGLLTKSPATFFLLFQPLLFLTRAFKSWRDTLGSFLLWLGLMVIVFVESQVIFSILRLFPLFSMISQKNSEFVIPLSEFIRHPFALFWGNLQSLITWEVQYLTPIIVLTIIAALAFAVKRKTWLPFILLALFIGPTLGIATFNKVLFVRYLLTFTPALILTSAFGIVSIISLIKNKALQVVILVLILVWPAFISLQTISDPVHAALPLADAQQYLHGWPAGWGVSEIRHYLSTQSQQVPKMAIITEGTFGLMPYALNIYQKDYPNLQIIPVWPFPNEPRPQDLKLSKQMPLYVLLYQRQDVPPGWKLEKVFDFIQGLGTDHLRLYRVQP